MCLSKHIEHIFVMCLVQSNCLHEMHAFFDRLFLCLGHIAQNPMGLGFSVVVGICTNSFIGNLKSDDMFSMQTCREICGITSPKTAYANGRAMSKLPREGAGLQQVLHCADAAGLSDT